MSNYREINSKNVPVLFAMLQSPSPNDTEPVEITQERSISASGKIIKIYQSQNKNISQLFKCAYHGESYHYFKLCFFRLFGKGTV